MLLESSDYHGNDNSFSYICCNPIASLKIEGNLLTKTFPDQTKQNYEITPDKVTQEIDQFTNNLKQVKWKLLNLSTMDFSAILPMTQ